MNDEAVRHQPGGFFMSGDEMDEKACSVCREIKPLADFYGDKRAPDGKKSACKTCHLAQVKRYAKANPDKVNARSRQWRARNRKAWLDSARKSRRKHRKQRRADTLAWRVKNPERAREILRAGQRNYKARKRAAEGYHTADDIARIYSDQKGRCAICRTSLKDGYHVDHIVALAAHGTNWPSNLQLLCQPCNCSKKDRDMTAVMQDRGLLL